MEHQLLLTFIEHYFTLLFWLWQISTCLFYSLFIKAGTEMSPFKHLNVFTIFIRTTESPSIRKDRILLQKADCCCSGSESLTWGERKALCPSVTSTVPSQSWRDFVTRVVVWGRLNRFQVLPVPGAHEDSKAVFPRTPSFIHHKSDASVIVHIWIMLIPNSCVTLSLKDRRFTDAGYCGVFCHFNQKKRVNQRKLK